MDRKALNILLAALDLKQRQLADHMGYDKAYVVNVFNGFAPPSDAFKAAFGDAVADLVLGESRCEANRLPAQPLIDFLEQRAKCHGARSEFYESLGLKAQGWNRRKYVSESLLDRICCQLGIHPTQIYGTDYEVGA
jgi:transcriptional regulator with XRE-family HTH domain